MDITEVRVKLAKNRDDRLKAFCSITIGDEFVVRDIKIIEGPGGYFTAMPSRKMTDHCDKCGGKNHLQAKYCNNCGASLPDDRAKEDPQGRMKLHVDIAHPVNTKCRRQIQERVVAAFKKELERCKRAAHRDNRVDTPEDDAPQAV